jgi:hypothetical protein
MTVLAILFGSLGIPVSVHACSMKKATTLVRCGKCGASRGSASISGTSQRGMQISAVPCCSDTHFVQRLAPAQLKTIERQLLDTPAVQLFFVAALLTPDVASPRLRPIDYSPPPLARQGQATYLFNSVFLI